MNEREKKLLTVLFGAAFIIANVFGYSMYNAGMKRMQAELHNGGKELKKKTDELVKADTRVDEMNWLAENQPAEGTHGRVGAELATYTERSAGRYGVNIKKRPSPLREDAGEGGAYRSAKVKVVGNARDDAMYRWLTDLQDPKKSRSVTFLRIAPQRDDPTRIDCELEVTQWFSPLVDGETVTAAETGQ